MAAQAAQIIAGNVFPEDDKKKDKQESIVPKEFFWDQFLTFLSGAILALSALNVSVEFLRGSGVSCFPPSVVVDGTVVSMPYELSRVQGNYVNDYCARSVPRTEYFPIYIIVHGILLVAPHYIWSALFKADFDSFFAIIEKLDRLRDFKTGEFDPKNVDRVRKLEIEYGGKRKRIFALYVAKLILQLHVCIGSIIFSGLFFTNFSFSFECPQDFDPANKNPSILDELNWPFNSTVPCVYTSLRLLGLIRYADHILNILAALLILIGLVWCLVRHPKELGAIDVAKFVFASCLTADSFSFPSWFKTGFFSFRALCTCCSFVWCCLFCCICPYRYGRRLQNLFHPRIKNDLDFLLMRLFRADSSHGRVFRDIQVEKELSVMRGKDHQLLHLFINVQQDMRNDAEREEREQRERGNDQTDDANPPPRRESRAQDLRDFFRESGFSNSNPEDNAFYYFKDHLGLEEMQWERVAGIRDRIYEFVKYGPKETSSGVPRPTNDMAVDISFGSSGFSLVLARPFREVVSMNFHPFYRNPEEVLHKEQFFTNYSTIKFPDNIFTQRRESQNQASDAMSHLLDDRSADFIIVGPIRDEAKRVTVNLLIELLYTGRQITEKAILLAIRPLRVADKQLTDCFCKYEPPKKLFRHDYHAKVVQPDLTETETVNGVVGVRVPCGEIPCVFEFHTYQFAKTYRARPRPVMQRFSSAPVRKNSALHHQPSAPLHSLSMPIHRSPMISEDGEVFTPFTAVEDATETFESQTGTAAINSAIPWSSVGAPNNNSFAVPLGPPSSVPTQLGDGDFSDGPSAFHGRNDASATSDNQMGSSSNRPPQPSHITAVSPTSQHVNEGTSRTMFQPVDPTNVALQQRINSLPRYPPTVSATNPLFMPQYHSLTGSSEGSTEDEPPPRPHPTSGHHSEGPTEAPTSHQHPAHDPHGCRPPAAQSQQSQASAESHIPDPATMATHTSPTSPVTMVIAPTQRSTDLVDGVRPAIGHLPLARDRGFNPELPSSERATTDNDTHSLAAVNEHTHLSLASSRQVHSTGQLSLGMSAEHSLLPRQRALVVANGNGNGYHSLPALNEIEGSGMDSNRLSLRMEEGVGSQDSLI